jgi:hypothetical protein
MLMTVGADTAQTVQLERDDRGRVARVHLFVKNDSDVEGRLSISFLGSLAGMQVELAARPSSYPTDPPALFLESGSDPPMAAPRQIVPVAVDLGVDRTADAGALGGTLVISLVPTKAGGGTVTPATFAVKAPVPKAAPPERNFVITRWWPLGWGGKPPHVDEDVRVPMGRDVAGTTLLGSGDGHTLKARLIMDDSEGAQPRDGRVSATVRVSGIHSNGSYSGELPLAPASADALKLSVHVRDFLLWPFLVFLLGAILGFLLTRKYDRHRRREVLRMALIGAVADYKARVPSPESEARLIDVLGPKPWFPSGIACIRDDFGPDTTAHLYCEIGRTKSDEEFAERGEAVKKKVADVDDLAAFDAALHDLEARKASLASIPDEVKAETDALIKEASDPPGTRQDFAARLRRHAQILQAFAAGWALWEPLDEEAKKQLGEFDPLQTWNDKPFASGDPKTTREALDALWLDWAKLAKWHHEHPAHPAAQRLAPADERFRRRVQAGGPAGPPPSVAPPLQEDERTPVQIRRALKRWDLVTAIPIAVVTAALALLPLYSAHDFGSWGDYLKVFAAGIAGQAIPAAIWGLFPGLRGFSMPASSAEKAATEKATT